MAKTCINHKETPAATMCHQCHSPVCKACSLVTPRGTFCSTECGILNRDFKERQREPEDVHFSKMTTIIKLMAAALLIGVGFIGINVAATHGVPQLKRIDVIGRFLDLFKPR